MTRHDVQTRTTTIQGAAVIVGALFLLIGIAGFIPGITTDYETMTFVGHESEAAIFGIFQVNVLHNIVHLLFGVVGLVAARTAVWSRAFLLYGGIIYLVLWLYGLVIDLESPLNFVALNTPDNWLHFFLGVGMVGAALVLTGRD